AIDGMFLLPRRVRYVTDECSEFGAFYRPADAEVVLCYETLRDLYERGQAHQQALGLGDSHPLRYVRANVRFIVLHETGHALVHLLDLPSPAAWRMRWTSWRASSCCASRAWRRV